MLFTYGKNWFSHDKSHIRSAKKSASLIKFASMPDNNGYPHDGRADKDPYPHDRRADKDSYPHDSNNQCIILRLQLSFAMINVQLMLV